MNDLDRIVARLERALDEADRVREASIAAARAITRLAAEAMRKMQRGEDVARDLRAAREAVSRLRTLLRRHPKLWHGGTVEGALQEVAEAEVVHAIVRRRPLPPPERLGVTPAAYVLGLGDAVGELRRLALDRMRVGDIPAATRYADAMEEMFHALLRFDYPDAVVAVRHKQDVARGLLERTRGELAVAARSAELERKLARLARR